MKKAWILAGLAAVALGLAGCGDSGKSETTSTDKTAPAAKESDTEAVAVKEAPVAKAGEKFTGRLEVKAFQGGFGIDFYEQAAKEFDAQNPGLTTTVTGGPRVWDELRPRLASNTPPDLMFPGWDMDHWGLVEDGQLYALDDALASPAYDGKGTWGDAFEPTLLKLGKKDGKQFILPYYFTVWGWWFDPDLFAKNGWTPPKTFEELLTLCDKIKAKGIAPITFQGKYPYYMIEGMLLPWALSVGGEKTLTDAQNLVPGAWKAPAMLQAAQMIAQLRDKGYFETGAVGLSHTESQTDFLNGKAAMIPCGTWLESEMKKVMRPGAKLQYMLPPVVGSGTGDTTAVLIEIEPWMVPSAGKNPAAAIAFYKYMTSLPKAKQFVEQKGTLMSIKGSDQAKLPSTLVVPSRVFRDSKTAWSFELRNWYKPMEKELENAMTSMVNGEITPAQFCDRAEAAAQKTAGDSSIAKHKIG